jgi:hypothetical protein
MTIHRLFIGGLTFALCLMQSAFALPPRTVMPSADVHHPLLQYRQQT